MVKGSSSQASTNVSRGGGTTTSRAAAAGGPPAGTAARRRPTRGAGGGMNRVSQNVMSFYTDDSPGIKIPPVVVVAMSFCFIAFVSILHVIGKIRGL